MQLSRDKVQTILDNAPQGADKKKILDGLIQRGYQLEGVDSSQVVIPTTSTSATEKRGAIGQIKDAFSAGINKTKAGFTDSQTAKNPLELIEGGLKTGAGLVETIAAPIAPVVAPIGKGIEFVADKISDIPAVQEFATSKAGEVTERVVEDISNANTIASFFLPARAPKGLKPPSIKINPNAKAKLSSYPKEIQTAITDKITTLDPKVKNILETATIEKFDNAVKAGQEALNNPRVLTPLERAGEKANNLLSTIKEDLGNIGRQKSASLESVGNTKLPDVGISAIKNMVDKTRSMNLTKAERGLVNQFVEEVKVLGKSPTLRSVDKLVDKLQATMFERKGGTAIPVTTRVKSIVNSAIADINKQLKAQAKKTIGGDEFSVLNDAYSRKIKLFDSLNKRLGEDGAKGGSLFKRFFSPQDSGTKKLFDTIKKEYGIDLAEDATLAKFVMDSLGDTRAKSLLEQVPMSPSGVITKGLEFIEKKLTDPIGKARRTIKKR